MQLTDSQVHVWAADRPERPWPPKGQHNEPHQAVLLSADRLLTEMDAADVVASSEERPCLSEADKTWVMDGGVCEWLGWKLP